MTTDALDRQLRSSPAAGRPGSGGPGIGGPGIGGPSTRGPRFPSSKFSAPGNGPHLVSRSRLLDRLDQGWQHRLTLVVGTAGAGKTVLLADWLARRPDWPAAWLSCDAADADPFRFFAAIIESLRRASAEPGLGEDARQLLAAEGAVSADVVAALTDDLEGLEGPRVLVIDDFHLTGAAGAPALSLLLEYRPPSLQLVVATRVDPQLRLHRMRSSEELVELRDRDLSFSAEETKQFLAGLDVELNARDIDLVHDRSEGWAAGLQMAAISIHASPDPVKAAGRVELHRHTVAGYFLDEVLYRQPVEVVDFMLATSVADELSVPMCTALCGPESGAMLEHLYRSHMFVTVVDEQARTYRYHQLIREVLRAELHARDPARERSLHVALAGSLAEAGQVGAATRHLLSAGDPTSAFKLLGERTLRDFSADPRPSSALDLDEVGPELFADRLEFLVPLATELLLRGAFERGSRALFLARRQSLDPAQQPELALKLGVANCLHAFGTGELDEALAFADEVRKLSVDHPDRFGEWLAGCDVLEMYCHTFMGQFSAARESCDAVLASPFTRPTEKEVLCPGVMSQAALAEGALFDARALADRALTSARHLGFDDHYYAFTGLRTLALLALEGLDLAKASALTERVIEMAGSGRPIFAYLAQLDRARVWAAQGNTDDAFASLPAARAALHSGRSRLLAKADELEARFRLALGDPGGAAVPLGRLPDDRRLVVSVMMALAAGDAGAASEQLHEAPAHGATVRSDLELRLLRATAAIMQGSSLAPQLVRESLAMAERNGFVQMVLDTSPQIVDHLAAGSSSYPASPTLAALIAARLAERKHGAASPVRATLPDPLTDAEIRVLEKLSQRLTYVDIASDLHLSLNTIKTHLRHSYMKLGVTSRTAALQRATSLGVI
ncbi:MAG TPA: LuxR C-terminal-related transcriptional regulator [Acidimicrobiales bacterium]|nr:LuxR C-terminal-related transcriptional regulator [Acidimicrobiales bacterium]